MGRFVEKMVRVPKGFKPQPPDGRRAGDYLSGRRDPSLLTEDPELLWIIDDKQPDGSLLYVFKDHSSVAYKPPKQ